MTKVLEAFKAELNVEGVARYKLGQDLERAKHDATKTKGRMGVVETKMKELRSGYSSRSDRDTAANIASIVAIFLPFSQSSWISGVGVWEFLGFGVRVLGRLCARKRL